MGNSEIERKKEAGNRNMKGRFRNSLAMGIHGCVLCMCVSGSVYEPGLCMCATACVCFYVCVFACVSVYLHLCVFSCVCVGACIFGMRVFVCVRACVHVCVCVCVCAYACMCERMCKKVRVQCICGVHKAACSSV